MTIPRGAELPWDDKHRRLRDRIAALEAQVMRWRHSPAESERGPASASQVDSDLHYKEVFDHISVCMFLVDVTADGRFQYAGLNSAEEQAVGLSSADVVGKFVEEVFDEDLARKLVGNYRRCVSAGVPITYDDELPLPGGRRHFHSNLIPLRDAAGRIYRLVGACFDTTDVQRTHEEALARQKLECLGVLAAGIAHDFHNLLSSVLAEAELAEAELAGGSSPRRELQAIKRVATSAGEIVRELMTYAGQGATSFATVDLSVLVEEMLGLLKISIAKHVTLKVDLVPNLPPVWANAGQLRQVVMNLIMNASESFGDKEGMIAISIAGVEGQDAVADLPRTRVLRLTIRDTGAGMTPEVLARIFDPFFTTKVAGRGLGLAAVQGIIRSHDGAITVTSAPGLGSCFEVLLPCTEQPAQDKP